MHTDDTLPDGLGYGGCWINVRGKVIPVAPFKHQAEVENAGFLDYEAVYDRGWIRVTYCDFYRVTVEIPADRLRLPALKALRKLLDGDLAAVPGGAEMVLYTLHGEGYKRTHEEARDYPSAIRCVGRLIARARDAKRRKREALAARKAAA